VISPSYQVDGEEKTDSEAGGDVGPVTDVESESVESVEHGREDEHQRQKRTQDVRLVAHRDDAVHVDLYAIIVIIIIIVFLLFILTPARLQDANKRVEN